MYRPIYTDNFDPRVLHKLSEIQGKIDEENQKQKPDKKELEKLMMQQLTVGFELNNGPYNNYRRNIPW